MPNWRDLEEEVDRVTVTTFDYGDVAYQKVTAGVPDGPAVPIPAEFDQAFVSLDMEDGNQVSTVGPAVVIHYADLEAAGLVARTVDRIVIGSGRAAGTYEIDDVQPNEGRTGATLKLKKL